MWPRGYSITLTWKSILIKLQHTFSFNWKVVLYELKNLFIRKLNNSLAKINWKKLGDHVRKTYRCKTYCIDNVLNQYWVNCILLRTIFLYQIKYHIRNLDNFDSVRIMHVSKVSLKYKIRTIHTKSSHILLG